MRHKFFFSSTVCHTKAKEPSQPNYFFFFSIAGGRIVGFIPFVRMLLELFENQSRPRFEHGSLGPFPTTAAVTSQKPRSCVIVRILSTPSSYSCYSRQARLADQKVKSSNLTNRPMPCAQFKLPGV